MTPKLIAENLLAGSDVKLAGLDEAEFHEVLHEVQALGKARAAVPPSDAETLRTSLNAAVQRAEKAEHALEKTKTELASLRTENAKLKAESANIEERIHRRAAQELCRIGIRESVPSAAAPTAKAPTATEQCLAAKAQEAATSRPVSTAPATHIGDDDEEE